jgi:hypothetical protein
MVKGQITKRQAMMTKHYGRDTHNTGITSILPESSSISNTGTDNGKY